MGAITLGELISYLGGASGTVVLILLLWLLLRGELIPKAQHDREIEQVRGQLDTEREAHRDQVSLLRAQIAAEEDEGRRWRDMALSAAGIAEAVTAKITK